MPTSQDRAAKIAAIKNLPQQLEQALHGLREDQLDTPYREGGWTVRQVIHHLADSHLNAFIRMKLIVAEDHPTLKPYDQDVWARLADSKAAPASSLAILSGLHDRWAVLMESLPEDAWKRVGLHPERGELTLDSLLNTYAAHGEKHIGHIMQLRKTKGW